MHGRYVRHWTDPDGAFRLDAKLTPDAGATVLSALQRRGRRPVHRWPARPTTQENPAAYQADALVALVAGEPLASDPSGSERPDRHGPRCASGSTAPR